MPLPKALARFNRVVSNPILQHAAKRLPGFAVVHHVGRRSGRAFHNPVNLFVDGDRYVIALTYGRDSQWVRNALAAGFIEVETRGHRLRLVDPEIVHDPARTHIPAPIRPILGALKVDDVLLLRRG
jgi:deazaflavin-dependent oxidoreductase (nitroreductase family)